MVDSVHKMTWDGCGGSTEVHNKRIKMIQILIS